MTPRGSGLPLAGVDCYNIAGLARRRGPPVRVVEEAALEHDFWLERWREGQIGFHKTHWNPMLTKHWPLLGIEAGTRVFVPLCGKSLDMRYLVSLGHEVVGIDLSEDAIDAFFSEGGESYEREELPAPSPSAERAPAESALAEHPGDERSGEEGRGPRRSRPLVAPRGAGVTLYSGDFFDLRSIHLDGIGAVYDRGALVALPDSMRGPYVAHLLDRIPIGTVLLVLALEYDRDLADGPPFHVPAAAVASMYGPQCEIEELDRVEDSSPPPRFVEAGLDVVETVYRIRKVVDRHR